MTAIHVDRYMFSVDEVVAAILPNVGRARELELRVDADGYVVIDVVAPVAPAERPDQKQEMPADDDTFPADRPSQAAPPPASSEPGPKEEEARSLCRISLFRAFLEVKTEEAAVKVLIERCHVKALADLDRTRSNGMNLRHVVEEFEAWKIT
ncbi:hypothetical protein [Rhizobium indigoferae]|uniref:Uncharacterized protein n=1 Tax=Rhizobium indigoferae TaxID=158891 RepID=A0ABZ0ZAU5_9HYPH|nr:hypothetical protein [Rhizobium indigoferae]NNU55069.1 hypothetical protein [Rhizobium indigoferae]WQN36638.1 hypothetical protein U5G49_001727 [Rhizobium indigoferae]GLR61164.1 hypothetical protein GCM10007919_58930 [Rhizobium indigoferae]